MNRIYPYSIEKGRTFLSQFGDISQASLRQLVESVVKVPPGRLSQVSNLPPVKALRMSPTQYTNWLEMYAGMLVYSLKRTRSFIEAIEMMDQAYELTTGEPS
jgi:hypothetical protein